MSTIRPFTALRPLPADVDLVSAVPYDVVNAEEARQLAADRQAERQAVMAEIEKALRAIGTQKKK